MFTHRQNRPRIYHMIAQPAQRTSQLPQVGGARANRSFPSERTIALSALPPLSPAMSSDEAHEPHESAKRRIRDLLLKRKSKRGHLEPPTDSTADGTDQLDLLDLVLFVVSRNIPVPLNADFKPRDRWGLLDDGRSYMAYKIRLPDPC